MSTTGDSGAAVGDDDTAAITALMEGVEVESSANELIAKLVLQLKTEKTRREEEFVKRTSLSEAAIAAAAMQQTNDFLGLAAGRSSGTTTTTTVPPATNSTTTTTTAVTEEQQQTDISNLSPTIVRRPSTSAHSIPHKVRTVLVAVDASEASQEAVDWSRRQGYILPTDLVVLLTVWEEQLEVGMAREAHDRKGKEETTSGGTKEKIYRSLNSVYSGLLGIKPDAIREHNDEALRSACQLMKELYQLFLSDCDVFPFVVASNNLAQSSIGSIICHTADQANADLIIVGSRGFGALKRFFVGSVSKFVIEHATNPVLLVKQ
eukprot:GHVS01060336.1.p1 GENE.GHVS01060336.1~~GHVS01060336.1.p1  ORF type:complete len:320 (+),score=76.89 GHVS01060336.1:397-1356(+)